MSPSLARLALIQSIILAPTVSCTLRASENPQKTNLPSDGVLVFTDRDIFSLRLVPLEEQIQALVRQERVEEALLLLDGVQGREPFDSYKVKRNL